MKEREIEKEGRGRAGLAVRSSGAPLR